MRQSRFLMVLLTFVALAGCAPRRLLRPPKPCPSCDHVQRVLAPSAKAPKVSVQGEVLRMPKTMKQFYAATGGGLAWSEDGCLLPLAADLAAALREADVEGLNPAEYHRPTIERLMDEWNDLSFQRNWDPVAQAELDLLLTDAYLLYASHLLGGHTRDDRVTAQWQTIRRKADIVRALRDALRTNTVRASLADFVPTHPGYQHLRSALQRYRAIAKAGGWPAIPGDTILKPGDRGPEVTAMRARLAAEGDEAVRNGGDVFDAALSRAVRRFQRRHGIDVDGRLGPQTREAMNVPISERIDQIKFSLDRWRWLPNDLGPRHIVVDIPAFSLTVIDGTSTFTVPVVVGKAGGSETPILSNNITYLEFSPEWIVPNSIATKEMLPLIQASTSYFERNHLEVLPLKGPWRPIPPASVAWSSVTATNFPYRLRQKPGPWNALGKVKLMFPNEYSVYIHGTADEGAFDHRLRMFSHGCVRVLDPAQLALFVLNDPDWTRERLNSFMDQKTPSRVPVAQPVPVYLVYWTAWADSDTGPIHFRPDIYGWDKEWRDRFSRAASAGN